MSNNSFENGAIYVRDNILAMLIGLQGKVGYSEDEDSEYFAYQKAYQLIADTFGDMFTKLKI